MDEEVVKEILIIVEYNSLQIVMLTLIYLF